MSQCNLGTTSKKLNTHIRPHISNEESFETELNFMPKNKFLEKKSSEVVKESHRMNEMNSLIENNIFPKFNIKTNLDFNTVNFSVIKSLCDTKYFKGK
jgi:hypothetical protein